MKAFVFSIGEKTTELCCQLLREQGLEVILYQDQTSLWDKLKRFYTQALESEDDEFMRVDADIIPFKNAHCMENNWGWTCAQGWDWYKQKVGAISIHKMRREVVELCLANIESAHYENRPESHLWRLSDINKKTKLSFGTYGLHGYGQQAESRLRLGVN